jgi:hypothetical protein
VVRVASCGGCTVPAQARRFRSCNCERRCKLRAFAPAFRPPPAAVLPKSRVVFLAFGSFFLPFFERDFRLKKRKQMPSWRSPALCRTRCQGREVCVHGSGAYGLDRPSGRGSALLRQEGQKRCCLVRPLCRVRWRNASKRCESCFSFQRWDLIGS